MAQRRRGSALEHALLEAAYEELVESGYARFTLNAVATRAGTSTPVLYRRWADKHELLLAAISHVVRRITIEVPDTGSLRGDVLAVLRQANAAGLEIVTTITVHLGGYYQETGSSPANLIDMLDPELPVRDTLETLYRRAADRGEIAVQRLTDRIKRLPFDLLRGQLLMTLRPLSEADLEEIVDTIFLPLLQARGATAGL
ncbi:TetR/AcrR family transcriptional regulator [Mycolicibacillus parakoreensis]|uniref:TetR/AcrR family transcriptional regulator n=1 Tax=Mycolicibacillus parakoreensis TaxID=1069221 RepID=A0ABY3U4L8_9MYCO|nr:TetR/AcrR family transcriptional regulator [Mycolicibacillus parakoreensis]MCV7316216.1 TetR/AcrR family transcriptional regulator [Mycolicibacillus parakoreensis]ULN52467.1 TetR/AcrR family transcriptional regulator [Mycolicibacillus parakoreensis]